MTRQLTFCLTILAGMVSGHVHAAKTGAHVHGVATLQVAQDGNIVSIDLDSPLDNLLGFEHAPRTDKQKEAVQRMLAKLHKPDALFVLTPAAQCKPGPVQLTAPVLKLGATDKPDPAKYNGEGEHAGINAEMTFACSTPAALKEIEVKLFDAFPGLRRLDTQVAGPRGQSAAKLTSKQRRIAW